MVNFRRCPLEKIYLSKGLLLDDIDPQYSKHRLLTIDENFTISENSYPKVYDRRIEEDVFINEISYRLMTLFKKLIEKNFIGSIALRPEYSLSGFGVSNLSVVLQQVERGERFYFENLGLSSVAKLYSKKYDNLWIVMDGKSITFEEILQDFDIYDDSIVTQVVHLEYEKVCDEDPLIVHIDHEYIFYTDEEFCTRQSNYKQKGSAKKRYKTFKIDKSKIPFFFDGIFVLYYILTNFFKEKTLLDEYFREILNT